MSFFDPVWTSDGKLYKPERYRDIIKERYEISKNLNTSYVEVGNISPLERSYLIQLIIDDLKRKHEITERIAHSK